MNKEQVAESLLNHSDWAIREMYNTINKDEKMKSNNEEFFQMLDDEIQRRKVQTNDLLDK